MQSPVEELKGPVTSKVWLITGNSRCSGRAFSEAVLKTGDERVAIAPPQCAQIETNLSGAINVTQ